LIKSFVLPYASEIRECADGAEALSVYEAQRPDLVLMDIRMNQVDGIQATKQIKTADHAAKIIMLTDYDDDALRQAAMRAGACAYALKDNLFDLVRLIDSMQEGRRLPD
jgi:DNA-binding NarL/FixJ family response regulator